MEALIEVCEIDPRTGRRGETLTIERVAVPAAEEGASLARIANGAASTYLDRLVERDPSFSGAVSAGLVEDDGGPVLGGGDMEWVWSDWLSYDTPNEDTLPENGRGVVTNRYIAAASVRQLLGMVKLGDAIARVTSSHRTTFVWLVDEIGSGLYRAVVEALRAEWPGADITHGYGIRLVKLTRYHGNGQTVDVDAVLARHAQPERGGL